MERKKLKAPRFIAYAVSPAGRTLRIIVGLIMVVAGFLSLSPLGSLVCAVGFFPLFSGAFDVCILGPLLNGYFRGDKMRAALHLQNGRTDYGTHSQSWLKA